ncbi:hypothetical protein QM996_09265 [Sinorhizobium chiapasense]
MDVTVNTGLGAGTRERDMLMIQMIQQLQEKLLLPVSLNRIRFKDKNMQPSKLLQRPLRVF